MVKQYGIFSDDGSITREILDANTGGVFSLLVTPDGNLVSGGRDRRLVEFDSNFDKTGREANVPAEYGPVRMLQNGPNSSLFVGTTDNAIIHGGLDGQFEEIAQVD